MRCLPDVALPSDMPFWVSRNAFVEHFDQEDFLCRGAKEVEHCYLPEWFHEHAGITRFLLPTVQFIGGKTQFISGRHRTAVLLTYLKELPMSFSCINKPPQAFFDRSGLRPLSLQSLIELPDLPRIDLTAITTRS